MLSSDLHRHVGKYYGKYCGEVTCNEDSKEQGRVRVRVPSIFNTVLEAWARPCLPYGHFFIPPVGTRVWVEFESGDPQYPIWVGVWHARNEAPEQAQRTPPDNRVIHTASGHTVELCDEDEEERIVIRHRDNSFVAIDKAGSVVISNKNGSTIYLNADAGEASLVSEHGHVLSMTDAGMVLMNKDGVSLDLTDDTVRITAANIVLDGTSVSLGNGADDFALLAQQFQTLWLQVQTHIHPSAMGPTGPSPTLAPLALIPAQHFTAAVRIK